MMFLEIMLALVIGCLMFAIPIALIVSTAYWTCTLKSSRPWIKFKDFVKLYDLDPSKWNVNYDFPRCIKVNSSRYHWDDYVKFKLNYIDYCRYNLWKWNLKRRENKEYARQQYEETLKALNSSFPIEFEAKKKSAIKDLCNYVSEQVRKKEE